MFYILLITWKQGRALVFKKVDDGIALRPFMDLLLQHPPTRVSGMAIFLSSRAQAVPHALLHNLKHNKVLHECVVFLTLNTLEVPHVSVEERVSLENWYEGIFRVMANYGFMDEIDVTALVEQLNDINNIVCDPLDTSYFISRETVVPTALHGMAIWREHLYAWMQRNAKPATEFSTFRRIAS